MDSSDVVVEPDLEMWLSAIIGLAYAAGAPEQRRSSSASGSQSRGGGACGVPSAASRSSVDSNVQRIREHEEIVASWRAVAWRADHRA